MIRPLLICTLFLLINDALAKSESHFTNPMNPFGRGISVHQDIEKRYRWISTKHIPGNAIIGGWYPNRNLFVCRAQHKGHRHAGLLLANFCYISVDDTAYQKRHFEILTGNGLFWTQAENGYVPAKAIKASTRINRPTFVCQAQFQTHWYPGEIYGQACVIAIGEQAVPVNRYRVLQSAPDDERRSNRIVYHNFIDR